jgi:lipoprotein-anchoring transpeptidase ErfK/SrfK
MRKAFIGAACLLASGAFVSAADAEVVVHVSKSAQTMHVYLDGRLQYVWPVSTAMYGYNTPTGVYYPTALDAYHRSGRYGAAMPYSIFFTGGYAIHGSYDIGNLGYPASHGCIRLHPWHASQLYGLVVNSDATRIIVVE